jgi:ubiquinone biosynthesis protein UbiJ
MFKSAATRLIQHLIAQNSWAHALLQPFAGKSVKLDFMLVDFNLVILENGDLAMAGESNIADAIVRISPSTLMRLLAKDEAAKLQITVEGDTHLATELGKVFTNMRWDYEDDLSKVVGDIPASKFGQLLRTTSHQIKDTGTNLGEMLFEYWQEEKPLIAKKRHVEQFNQDVDTLRADVDRMEKRLEKLAQKLSDSSLPKP